MGPVTFVQRGFLRRFSTQRWIRSERNLSQAECVDKHIQKRALPPLAFFDVCAIFNLRKSNIHSLFTSVLDFTNAL